MEESDGIGLIVICTWSVALKKKNKNSRDRLGLE
jgi:hypothetical protein